MSYLQTDSYQDAVFSIESATSIVREVSVDVMWWKWTLIAVHSAVQGFMVLALERGNGLAAMSDQDAKKWMEAYEKGMPTPRERMDNFLSLYDKIKSPLVEGYFDSRKFPSTAAHDKSMEQLNDLRNDFIHFMPKSWSVELEGLPIICSRCLEVARYLAFESHCILWHDDYLRENAFGLSRTSKASYNAYPPDLDATGESNALGPRQAKNKMP